MHGSPPEHCNGGPVWRYGGLGDQRPVAGRARMESSSASNRSGASSTPPPATWQGAKMRHPTPRRSTAGSHADKLQNRKSAQQRQRSTPYDADKLQRSAPYHGTAVWPRSTRRPVSDMVLKKEELWQGPTPGFRSRPAGLPTRWPYPLGGPGSSVRRYMPDVGPATDQVVRAATPQSARSTPLPGRETPLHERPDSVASDLQGVAELGQSHLASTTKTDPFPLQQPAPEASKPITAWSNRECSSSAPSESRLGSPMLSRPPHLNTLKCHDPPWAIGPEVPIVEFTVPRDRREAWAHNQIYARFHVS